MVNISVEKFIEKLQQYPLNAGLQIDDADTGWRIGVIHLDYDVLKNTVSLYGLYSEMEDDQDGKPYQEPQ